MFVSYRRVYPGQTFVQNILVRLISLKSAALRFTSETGALPACMIYPYALAARTAHLLLHRAPAGWWLFKNTMNGPPNVLDLLELNATASKPTERVAAEAPVLKVKMEGIHPGIGGVKNGFDALETWCCRTGKKEFTRLATVTHLPYFDNRPNAEPAVAEQRDYYAYYLK